jgi:hypothetical protein
LGLRDWGGSRSREAGWRGRRGRWAVGSPTPSSTPSSATPAWRSASQTVTTRTPTATAEPAPAASAPWASTNPTTRAAASARSASSDASASSEQIPSQTASPYNASTTSNFGTNPPPLEFSVFAFPKMHIFCELFAHLIAPDCKLGLECTLVVGICV